GELGIGEEVLCVHDEEEAVGRLEVHAPGARRRCDEADGLRQARIAHVDDREPAGERVRDVREARLDHDPAAVRPPTLVGVPEEREPVREVRCDGHRSPFRRNANARATTNTPPLMMSCAKYGTCIMVRPLSRMPMSSAPSRVPMTLGFFCPKIA